MLNKIIFPFLITVSVVAALLFIQNKNEIVTVIDKNEIYITANDCKIEKKECVIELNEFKVKISFDENIYYLKPFNVSVSNVKPYDLKIESVQVNFKMNKMNMGVNRFILKNTVLEINKHVWQGTALLPICVSGRADWFSEFEVTTKNSKYLISLPILVKRAAN